MIKKTLPLVLLLFLQQLLLAQSADFIAAQAAANAFVTASGFSVDAKNNVIRDGSNIIHIFLYEDGNVLLKNFPTTATEKNKFQVHLYVRAANADNYLVEYVGKFEPSFNIEGKNTSIVDRVAPGAPAPPPHRIDFAVAGPYTGNLVINVKHLVGENYNGVVSATIRIAKTIHASIGSGPVYTTLRNWSNIKTLAVSNGGNTLVADDQNGRVLLGIFATFYPAGRNDLLMPTLPQRLGIILGTGIGNGASRFSDVFAGAQFDFAVGGSIITGLHYGRVQRITGIDKKFVFGTSTFTGDLDAKKYMEWQPGFFFGIQVDNRVFTQIFK